MTTNSIPPRWYVVDRHGMATLCQDEDDAKASASDYNYAYRQLAPYVAVQLAPVGQPAQHDIDTGKADDSANGGAQTSPESRESRMVIDDDSRGEVDDPVAQRPGYGYHDGENPPNSHLYQLMAPYHLNLCRGQELRSVIDFGRDVWGRALTTQQPQREEALRRAIGLLGMAVARLGPEDHEIRDRIQGFICPAADSDQQQGEQNA